MRPYLCRKERHLRVNLKKLGPNRTSNHVQGYELSQSVQLQISDQVRASSNNKAIWVFGVGAIWESWSKYLKSRVGIHMKIHKLVSQHDQFHKLFSYKQCSF